MALGAEAGFGVLSPLGSLEFLVNAGELECLDGGDAAAFDGEAEDGGAKEGDGVDEAGQAPVVERGGVDADGVDGLFWLSAGNDALDGVELHTQLVGRPRAQRRPGLLLQILQLAGLSEMADEVGMGVARGFAAEFAARGRR